MPTTELIDAAVSGDHNDLRRLVSLGDDENSKFKPSASPCNS